MQLPDDENTSLLLPCTSPKLAEPEGGDDPSRDLPSADAPDTQEVHTSPSHANGLSVAIAAVFLVGEMAGAGVLALPSAAVGAGWFGFPLLLTTCVASAYAGVLLGDCLNILRDRHPEFRGVIRDPFPAIGEKAFGKWMKYTVSIVNNISLYGAATVFLLLIAQNVHSLVQHVGLNLSTCYWSLIAGAALVPFSWLGTPKDMWPIAVGAAVATTVACLLLFGQILATEHARSSGHVVNHPSPTIQSFAMSLGTMMFAFGGSGTFPTIQHDMREPQKFWKVVVSSYAYLVTMYLVVAATGFFVFGGEVAANILQTLPPGGVRIAVEILITCHLLLAIIIVVNPVAQDLEEVFKIPHRFGWKRCLLRTILMAGIIFLAETIPHFGNLLSFIGGSTLAFLSFVAPCAFHWRISSQRGDWPARTLLLRQKLVAGALIVLGALAGAMATYASLRQILSPDTFVPPCYVNISITGG